MYCESCYDTIIAGPTKEHCHLVKVIILYMGITEVYHCLDYGVNKTGNSVNHQPKIQMQSNTTSKMSAII